MRLSGEKAAQTPSDTSTSVELVFKDYKVRLPETPPAARAGAGGKRCTAPGESAPKPLAAWAAHGGGKRRAAPGERAPKPLAA